MRERRTDNFRPAGTALAHRAKQRRLSLAVLSLFITGFVLTIIAGTRPPSVKTGPVPESIQGPDLDYSTFSHKSQRHSSLDCTACHQRASDNSARPNLPGHKSCTNCHLTQFVTPSVPMCLICHTDVKTSAAPLKPFPEQFKESFNVKFDHAQHMSGQARPQQGCIFCHERPLRRGAALSIPAGLSAHNQCYTCHTPNRQSAAGLDISSCQTCHAQSAYKRTSTMARAFSAGFSHAEHSQRQRLNCSDCHTPKPGLVQSTQVSVPRLAEHFPTGREMSCQSCHNGKRAFGESDFSDCRRCHKAPTFRMPI